MYNNDKKLKSSDYHLPGTNLKEDELVKLIENSRSRGMISLKYAHFTIRQNKKPFQKVELLATTIFKASSNIQ